MELVQKEPKVIDGERKPDWISYFDELANRIGGGASVMLERLGGDRVEHSLQFNFHTTNSQDECESLIAGLKLTMDMGG